MGNSNTSFENKIQVSSSKINTQHSDIDEIMLRINTEADRIITLILEREYTDRDALCKKVGYQKMDELSGLFQVQTLDGIRYRLGVVPPNTYELETNKQKICMDIVNFYLKKVNLITNIQKELPNCRQMERNIFNNLTNKLNSKNARDEEWYQVYDKLEKFNKEIKTRYELFERELERVRLATTVTELDAIAVTTNTILAKTNAICKNYENYLIGYSEVPMQERPSLPMQARPSLPMQARPSSPMQARPASPSPMQARPASPSPMQARPAPASPSPMQARPSSPMQARPSSPMQARPSSPMQARPPMPTDSVFNFPVPRDVSPPGSPVFYSQRIPQNVQAPKKIVKTEEYIDMQPRMVPRVQTNIQEVPVIQRTVLRPKVVRREVVNEDVVPMQVPMQNQYQVPMQNQYQVPIQNQAQYQAQYQVPMQVPMQDQDYEPVEEIPERRPSVETRVRADKIVRTPAGYIVNNPSRIQVTETIPREHIGTHRPHNMPGATVKVEPLYGKRTTSIPVRAVNDHVPRSPGEIPLRMGQATLFLGKGEKGWSRVRHSNGMEGYVPHAYLSKK